MTEETKTGTPSGITVPEHLTRFSGIVDVTKIAEARVVIIGCGAVGRQTAMQLASMGVRKFKLIDYDTVDAVNVGSQGWPIEFVGKPKVLALADEMAAYHAAEGELVRERWIGENICLMGAKYDIQQISEEDTHVFVCVDNMDVRAEIVNDIEIGNDLMDTNVQAVFEARMGAQVCSVRVIRDDDGYEDWRSDWYPQSEADEADTTDCTTKATIFCASMAGALMCKTFMDVINDMPVPFCTTINMATREMWREEAGTDDSY